MSSMKKLNHGDSVANRKKFISFVSLLPPWCSAPQPRKHNAYHEPREQNIDESANDHD
jgi:hypothetical protein